MHVVVVGAGIVGASLAYALSRRGAAVTVVDAATPAAGATGHSFGWINASFFADAAHFALRAEGIEAHRQLCRDLDLPVSWTGCLCWEEQGDALDQQAAVLTQLGYAARIVGEAEITWMEPQVRGVDRAVFFEDEAAAEASAFTRAMLAASGAQVLSGCAVGGFVEAGARVVGLRLPGGTLPCDRVVVASGIGSAALLQTVGVALPMLLRPGVILRTAPLPPLLSHVCVAPIGEFRQLPDGRILMPTAISHQADSSEELAMPPDQLAELAVSRLRKVLPDIPLEWKEVALAARPVPKDGLPVIGACGPEGLFTAVMHSGITLAGVAAEILSAEVMDQPLSNAQAALVAPYRPARFQP